jgi:hypothetical protein
MLNRVRELSPEQKHAAEILLGHPVSEDQAVSLKSLDASTIIASELSPEERITALGALNNRMGETVGEEEEDAVSEAMRRSGPITGLSVDGGPGLDGPGSRTCSALWLSADCGAADVVDL